MRIVLVCGGRGYDHAGLVDRCLDRLHAEREITILVHGGADGADTLAGRWARGAGVREEPFPILPGEGGFRRNERMLAASEPDLVVHFPGRRGTADMVHRAREAGVPVVGGLEVVETELELPF